MENISKVETLEEYIENKKEWKGLPLILLSVISEEEKMRQEEVIDRVRSQLEYEIPEGENPKFYAKLKGKENLTQKDLKKDDYWQSKSEGGFKLRTRIKNNLKDAIVNTLQDMKDMALLKKEKSGKGIGSEVYWSVLPPLETIKKFHRRRETQKALNSFSPDEIVSLDGWGAIYGIPAKNGVLGEKAREKLKEMGHKLGEIREEIVKQRKDVIERELGQEIDNLLQHDSQTITAKEEIDKSSFVDFFETILVRACKDKLPLSYWKKLVISSEKGPTSLDSTKEVDTPPIGPMEFALICDLNKEEIDRIFSVLENIKEEYSTLFDEKLMVTLGTPFEGTYLSDDKFIEWIEQEGGLSPN